MAECMSLCLGERTEHDARLMQSAGDGRSDLRSAEGVAVNANGLGGELHFGAIVGSDGARGSGVVLGDSRRAPRAAVRRRLTPAATWPTASLLPLQHDQLQLYICTWTTLF